MTVASIIQMNAMLAAILLTGCSGLKASEGTKIASPQECTQGSDCEQDSAVTDHQQQTDVRHEEEPVHSPKGHPNGEHALGVTILDAAFTDRIVNRQPETRVKSWSLKDRGSRAWIWVKVHCTGPCLKRVGSSGKAQLTFHWYLETKSGFVKKYSASLPVKAEEWRTWAIKRDLVPGKWKVMIVADSGQVCSEQEGNCEFLLQVVS